MTNETDTTQTEETYLGDSTFVYLQEDGLIILTRRFSDGSERKIRMDEVVLSEFLAWFSYQWEQGKCRVTIPDGAPFQ